MDMGKQPVSTTIILYGRSLLLDSVELTLRQNGRHPILRLADTSPPAQLDDVPLGMIIYDGDQVEGTAVYQPLTDYPGWRLVGLTASKEELLIIRRRHLRQQQHGNPAHSHRHAFAGAHRRGCPAAALVNVEWFCYCPHGNNRDPASLFGN